MKRVEAGKKMAKARKPAGIMPKSMKSAMPQDMKVCQKPHDMEHYRLSDEDDACFDSVR